MLAELHCDPMQSFWTGLPVIIKPSSVAISRSVPVHKAGIIRRTVRMPVAFSVGVKRSEILGVILASVKPIVVAFGCQVD
jgi:hypothetical protein